MNVPALIAIFTMFAAGWIIAICMFINWWR